MTGCFCPWPLAAEGEAPSEPPARCRRYVQGVGGNIHAVTTLELYLHEIGSKSFKFFPTPEVFRVVELRARELREHLFGYQILPFAHGKNEAGEDFGLYGLENPFQRL